MTNWNNMETNGFIQNESKMINSEFLLMQLPDKGEDRERRRQKTQRFFI